jgi:hypothetical protein
VSATVPLDRLQSDARSAFLRMHTRLEDAVCSEVLRVREPEQVGKLRMSTMHPALDRADPRSTDFGSLLVGKALRRDQQERLQQSFGLPSQASEV